ncbi:ABC transporter permease [Pararobbsia silviterrae]|uniref:ABC transporter permease n=1 Tax=Pararobbsia silviterrae TaxID=1792498 RepID=A0A494XSY5_9BURK|nr:ABC transporter permease [Pararobbsia silviterrae]RKP53762.1 ABC transporter permease [Pararobbsia silviterrae]
MSLSSRSFSDSEPPRAPTSPSAAPTSTRLASRGLPRQEARAAADDPARVNLGRAVFAVLVIGLWEVSARWLFDPFWIGQPSAIVMRLWSLLESGDLWWHSIPTIGEAVAGLALSLIVGIPIGLAFALNRYVQRVLEPFFLGLYSIPRIALAPLFILWFGVGPMSKIVMAFSLVVFVVILNTYEGMRGVDPELIDMMRAMRASYGYILRKVLLPAIVPWIFASIRVGVGLALIGSVVGELIGSNRGLGWYVEWAAGRVDITGVFTGLVLLMVAGMLLNEAVKLVERRVLRKRY